VGEVNPITESYFAMEIRGLAKRLLGDRDESLGMERASADTLLY